MCVRHKHMVRQVCLCVCVQAHTVYVSTPELSSLTLGIFLIHRCKIFFFFWTNHNQTLILNCVSDPSPACVLARVQRLVCKAAPCSSLCGTWQGFFAIQALKNSQLSSWTETDRLVYLARSTETSCCVLSACCISSFFFYLIRQKTGKRNLERGWF